MLLKHSRGTVTNRVCAARGCSPREMASYKGCRGSEAQLWKLPKLCRCAVGKQPIRTGHGLIKWNPESCDFRGSLGKPGQDKDWLSTMRKELRLFENHRGIAEPAGSLKLRCFDKRYGCLTSWRCEDKGTPQWFLEWCCIYALISIVGKCTKFKETEVNCLCYPRFTSPK